MGCRVLIDRGHWQQARSSPAITKPLNLPMLLTDGLLAAFMRQAGKLSDLFYFFQFLAVQARVGRSADWAAL
jgi:hypothetical protein